MGRSVVLLWAWDAGVTHLLIARLADRVTCLIDKDGKIKQVYSSVRPGGHAPEVLKDIET